MTRAGHTRIAPAALRHTIETIAARAFGVPGANVAAVLEDDAGRLGATVSVHLALPPLLGRGRGPGPLRGVDGGTVFDLSRAARATIISRGLDLTGRTLGRVDIRLRGAKQPAGPARVDAPAGRPHPNPMERNAT
ncbi:hypothetical protein [Arthrobacter oryzae]|uniref:Asp23/Gls24 family envelope stress response protein n=1 Tax=Arthrobacter oryzae TaxID=409290 RepID=A0A495EF72_9MICC|nr:hypothetical protein [Arthrobacter oryzae]RKR15538.1 hypothetical protein C8D78_3060 [Arthrobacter oryzae]